MRKLLYFVLLLSGLSACSKERKPLEILPLVAKDVMLIDLHLETTYYPVLGSYYFKNFRDDKQCLKEFMQFVKDTMTTKEVRKTRTGRAIFYKNNRGSYVEEREGRMDFDKHRYVIRYVDSLSCYMWWFATSSKYNIRRFDIDEFPQRCDYPYHIVRKDKSAVVYFDYKEFNTDVWQKFLNVVFYDREKIKLEDYRKYKLYTPPQKVNWRNWSAPTRYSLLNQYTRQIECVIEYPLANDYTAFTMEIH